MTGTSFRWSSFAVILAAMAVLTALVLSVGGLARLLIICALLAYILDPVACRLEALGLSRLAATLLIFLILGVIVAGLCAALYPVFMQELRTLQIGEHASQTTALTGRVERFIREYFGFLGWEKLNLAQELEQAKLEVGKGISGFLFSNLVSSVTHVVTIPFITFFFLKDGRQMKRRLVGLVPNRYFEFSLDVLYKMDLSLGNFLRGQFLDGVIFGVLATIAMWALNVKYFLFIGVFAGLANFIPYFGPLAGALLAVVVVLSSTTDLTRVFYVAVAFVLIKLLDDAVIQPLTVARSAQLHPLLVLLAIIIGGNFFGVLGMLLAVPVTAFLKVAFDAGVTSYREYLTS